MAVDTRATIWKMPVSMARLFKFPDPNDRPRNEPGALCSPDRVLAIFNQATGQEAKYVALSVKKWFTDAALAAGWVGVAWFNDVADGTSAGCVLTAPGYEINVLILAPAPPALGQ